MQSPLLVLEPQILASPDRIAPERSNALAALKARRNVQVHVDRENNPIVLASNPQTGDVVVGLHGLERLWAHAHAYWCVYQVAQQARAHRPASIEINLLEDPRTDRARDLLLWALREEEKVATHGAAAVAEAWPRHIPRPGSGTFGSDTHVTDEIFLCATGTILHHELGHIDLQHGPCAGPQALQEEFEADAHASDWVLGAPRVPRDAFMKRSLGVMVAHMWLASYYIHGIGSDDPLPTHPPGPSRLVRSLERHVTDPNGTAWFFAATALCLHLQNRAPALDTFGLGEFESARACVDRLVVEALRVPASMT